MIQSQSVNRYPLGAKPEFGSSELSQPRRPSWKGFLVVKSLKSLVKFYRNRKCRSPDGLVCCWYQTNSSARQIGFTNFLIPKLYPVTGSLIRSIYKLLNSDIYIISQLTWSQLIQFPFSEFTNSLIPASGSLIISIYKLLNSDCHLPSFTLLYWLVWHSSELIVLYG